MTKLTNKNFDCITGQETITELTDAEVAEMAVQAQAAVVRKAEKDAAAEALAAVKTSAKAKLVAGQPLTEEEAATLVI